MDEQEIKAKIQMLEFLKTQGELKMSVRKESEPLLYYFFTNQSNITEYIDTEIKYLNELLNP